MPCSKDRQALSLGTDEKTWQHIGQRVYRYYDFYLSKKGGQRLRTVRQAFMVVESVTQSSELNIMPNQNL
jgi:hypothetical protein